MPFPPFAPKTLAFATAALGALFARGAAAMEPTAKVIGYYNASLDHFFITAYRDEPSLSPGHDDVQAHGRLIHSRRPGHVLSSIVGASAGRCDPPSGAIDVRAERHAAGARAEYRHASAAVFTNNGQGVRGDMKAVITAILTDPEVCGARVRACTRGRCIAPPDRHSTRFPSTHRTSSAPWSVPQASLFPTETRPALPTLSTELLRPNPSRGRYFAPPAAYVSKRCIVGCSLRE
jgi:hypothetical protein